MRGVRYFVEPYDMLVLRGNKLFGDPGSFGESLMPPWPSVAAGAFRSALLVARGHSPSAFAAGRIGGDLDIGTPDRPGTFTVTNFSLARRDGKNRGSQAGHVESLHAAPADIIVRQADDGAVRVCRVSPIPIAGSLRSSATTEQLAVLAQANRGKPMTGQWLTPKGWSAHLACNDIDERRNLLSSDDLWTTDTRIGIALDPGKRRASDGALFTTQAVSLRKREQTPDCGDAAGADGWDVGFVVEIAGVADDAMPDKLTLRLGGDGRAALATRVSVNPVPRTNYAAIADARRCRLILTSPGLFTSGWLPTGATRQGVDIRFALRGVSGRLVCASVPRAEVVSGFDLARRRPKPAQRVSPTGSVYWLEDLQASPDALRNLADCGLWSDPVENESRRAEGFNRFTFGEWRDRANHLNQ